MLSQAGAGRQKGTQRAVQAGGSSQDGVRRREAGDAAASSGHDLSMEGVHDLLDDAAGGPEGELEALLEKRVHVTYDRGFGDDFDDDDV